MRHHGCIFGSLLYVLLLDFGALSLERASEALVGLVDLTIIEGVEIGWRVSGEVLFVDEVVYHTLHLYLQGSIWQLALHELRIVDV